MSSIIENLKKIMESRYGKDVRQAIHDSISDINDIATEAQEKAITAQDSAEASATAAQASATASADSATAAAESAAEAKGYAPEGYDELKAEVATIDEDLGDKTSASAVTGDDAFSKIDTLNTSISTVDGKVDVSSIPSALGTTCGAAISALNDEVGASSIPSALGTSCGAAISAINTDLAMDSIPSALGTTVGGAISSLNSNLANIFKLVSCEISYTIAAGTYAHFETYSAISKVIPSGYSFAGIVGFATNLESVSVSNLKYGSDSYACMLQSARTSQATGSLSLSILCLKN